MGSEKIEGGRVYISEREGARRLSRSRKVSSSEMATRLRGTFLHTFFNSALGQLTSVVF